jgi:hypothetical protein
MAGSRYYDNGSLFNVGTYGFYWSSTVDGIYSRFLYFYSTSAFVNYGSRAAGHSVRCLKD